MCWSSGELSANFPWSSSAGGISVKQDTPENSFMGLFVLTQDTKFLKILRATEVVRAANML